MAYGKIEYNDDGLPMCEECGMFFHRVTAHARQVHKISARDYKIKHGLDVGAGVCSEQSKELARQRVMENYDLCIAKNLIKGGKKTRRKKGDPGRTKDQISAQTMAELQVRLLNKVPKEKLIESGKKLGASGLGAKARWGNKSNTKKK